MRIPAEYRCHLLPGKKVFAAAANDTAAGACSIFMSIVIGTLKTVFQAGKENAIAHLRPGGETDEVQSAEIFRPEIPQEASCPVSRAQKMCCGLFAEG
jgi:hypothetical protein